MHVFKRLFKFTQAEAHAALDKFEDPVKMTEQGIRDLKQDLENSLKSLAEVKAITIRTKRESDEKKEIATDYEKKAMLLLTKAQKGEVDPAEAERLAGEALAKKDEALKMAMSLTQNLANNEKMIAKLESNCQAIKAQVRQWENEAVALKARAKVSSATKKLNAQLAKVDSSGTITMLEKMKDKVAEDEALAESYGDIAMVDQSIDNEIDAALASGQTSNNSDSLAALKKKMGLE
ncbi:MAG: PspA/IM30 family protein [bacterium]|nr:PspA/IM30 family protein [bacterium]